MNGLTPQLKQQIESVDYTQFLPMGRFSAVARRALSPQSIAAGARAFEKEMAAYQLSQKKMMLEAVAKRRALAAQEEMKRQFAKVWPEGSSEKLIKNYITGNKIMNPWKK